LSLNKRKEGRSLVLFLWIACLSYGLLIELLQHFFIANRYFDWIDLLADAAGASLGLFVVGRYIKK
jgi:VanZ family protein